MRKLAWIFVVASTIVIAILRSIQSLPSRGQSTLQNLETESSDSSSNRPNLEILKRLTLDTNTWYIYDSNGFLVDSDINSPEAVRSRWQANINALDLKEYDLLFPPSLEKQIAVAAAFREIQSPKNVEERLAEAKAFGNLQEWQDAIRAISNPVPTTGERIQQAIENEPNGPWAVIYKKTEAIH